MRFGHGVPAVLAVLALAVPSAARADSGPWLVEATVASGVDFVHQRAGEQRYWLPEIMSGGVCLLDHDRDGDLDLYFVQGGEVPPNPSAVSLREESAGARNALFRNDGPAGFVEVAAEAGVADGGYGMGCAVGDVDGDGWSDLYVTNLGPNALFLNRRDGSFERAAAEWGASDPGWGSSAAFLDYDLDGDSDLFVVNYIDWSAPQEVDCFSGGLRDYCHPDRFKSPGPDRLLRNRGDGRFEDVTESSGVAEAFGNGLGVTVADFDDDGLADVYVANDGMPNQLWNNQGDGTFRDVALLAGVAVNRVGTPEAGMGVQAFDADGDLDPDLFVSHLRAETNTLYLNQGGGLFADLTAASGLGAASLGFTGFGLGFVDFDHDGAVDLFVANGRVGRGLAETGTAPFAEPDHLYRGLGGGRYQLTDSGELEAAEPPRASRGAAFGDLDGDGDVDVAVVASGDRARLLRNVGAEGRWIGVAAPPGSRVVVSAGGERHLRLAASSFSYCSASESRVHVGVGAAETVESVAVERPGGEERRYLAVPSAATLVLPEGR